MKPPVPSLKGRRIVTARQPGGRLSASMSPRDGGELSSVAIHQHGDKVELLYRGNQWSPPADGWQGRSPWLWPVAGRCYTAHDAARTGAPDFDRDECSWLHAGQRRPMMPHGFARQRPWRVIASNPNGCRLELPSHEREKSIFPFDYILGNKLVVSHEELMLRMSIKADASNTCPMPFHVGLHTTLDFSAWWGETWFDGRIAGLGSEAYDVDNVMQVRDRFTLPSDGLALNDPRLGNTIIAANEKPTVRLISPDGQRVLRMSFGVGPSVADVDRVWVTHVDPTRRFFCCEPWIGWPNAINTGRGRIDLNPGASWDWWISFKIDGPA